MTMVYARIADRIVAEEYFSLTNKVEIVYAASQTTALPAGPAMHAEAHKRLLGNGYCARSIKLAPPSKPARRPSPNAKPAAQLVAVLPLRA